MIYCYATKNGNPREWHESPLHKLFDALERDAEIEVV